MKDQNASSAIDKMLKPMLTHPFDASNFADIRESPLTTNLRCSLVTPLLKCHGRALATSAQIYFQPAESILGKDAAKAMSWSICDIIGTARRYNGLKDSSIEIFLKNNELSVLLAFQIFDDRERVMAILPDDVPCRTDRDFVNDASNLWKIGHLSNFEYLLALNSAAGRTFHDLSRYPIFPWVISDYKSSKLDLKSKEVFRDLSKPVGALDAKRLEYFQERLKSMHDMENPFLYGTHYSAPGYVLYYLLRSMPEHMLCLQNGRFDAPDRMFHSMEHCFSSVNINPADVKELIPQFFDTEAGFDFLINARCLQLGNTQNGERVHDVILPPWARSPRDFIKKNRKALESASCTQDLPKWIDLVFGCNSRGENAKEASNLFHRMSYMGSADLEKMDSDQERHQTELQATEFGIVPDQLFASAHPSRNDNLDIANGVLVETKCETSELPSDVAERTDSTSKLITDTELPDFASKNAMIEKRVVKSADEMRSQMKKSDPNASRKIEKSCYQQTAKFESLVSSDVNILKQQQLYLSKVGLQSSSLNKEFIGQLGDTNKLLVAKSSFTSTEQKDFFRREESSKGEHSKSADYNKSSFEKSSNDAQPPTLPSLDKHERYMKQKKSSNAPSHSSQTSMSDMFSINNGEDSSSRRLHTVSDQQQSTIRKPTINKNKAVVNDISVTDLSELREASSSALRWNLTKLTSSDIHSHSVSGCFLLLHTEPHSLTHICLVSVSLDGGMMVHTLESSRTDERMGRRGSLDSPASAHSRGSRGSNGTHTSSKPKLKSFRCHSSSDPLACLAVTSDGMGGNIVFSGGHDDIVLAYGISSACALASLYSHRDAVTGICIIDRASFSESARHSKSFIGSSTSDLSTHLMISCSWDATVKIWSVTLADGETVSINREPVAELFDADSSIVCLDAIEVQKCNVVICAGCTDGSLVFWFCGMDGTKDVIHRERAARGSCSCVKWTTNLITGDTILFAGFSAGNISAFLLRDKVLQAVSSLPLGSPVKCLDIHQNLALVGCADGGLRVATFTCAGRLKTEPRLWKNVNGGASPGISSVCIRKLSGGDGGEVAKHAGIKQFLNDGTLLCSIGAENGNVTIYEMDNNCI